MCTLLGEILSTTYPEVYEHLYETSGLEVNTMIQYLFSSQILSIFIGDLQDINPEIATHILDVFLLEGEIVICTLFIKFIEHSQVKIMLLDDENFDDFIKHDLPRLCLE
jgi:ABC-type antimicrobial peptide transport system permease subunit